MLRTILDRMMFSWWSIYAWTGIVVILWMSVAVFIKYDPLFTIGYFGLLTVGATLVVIDMWWKKITKRRGLVAIILNRKS